MNKTQIKALCSKIKNRADSLIREDIARLKKSFVLTPNQQYFYDEMVKVEKAIKRFNETIKTEEVDGVDGCYEAKWWLDSGPADFYEACLDSYICKNKIKFDFTTLYEDLVLKTIDSHDLEVLISNALITYKIKKDENK